MFGSPIAILGLGYVGLPLAAGLARAGNEVVGFDLDERVIDGLSQGNSHIQDISDAELAESISAGLRFTSTGSDLHGFGAYIICVPTPLAESGYPDLSFIEQAGALIASQMRSGSLVVLESTTYPGTTDELLRPILESGSGLKAGIDFCLSFSPERIDPGNPEFKVTNTPKVVGGYQPCCLEAAASIYTELGIEVVRAKGLREAELSKLLENTYRHINIALVNEMVKFCNPLGIDLHDAIRCAATKPFGFQAFYPGPGVGGHCIPIDPNYLSYRVRSELGYAFRFVELAQEINASMPSYVVTRLQDELNEHSLSLKGSRVLVAGVTYKADVPDERESPAVPIAEILINRGAIVSYLDPYVTNWQIQGSQIARVIQGSLEGGQFDAVVLLQSHTDFDALDFESLAPVVLDTRGSLQGAAIKRL
ncbi:MAG: nucleotide sugar dehydrogenase [Actinobacteria bacterium]|uniref:Unannotated protein n=1 Tax=freshwater metagenome TaxID=449393 RepID=A0A6J7H807_9ZZZZ|nr:nucleotide sugar dehydrogenase [Actinomycetota bacterium]